MDNGFTVDTGFLQRTYRTTLIVGSVGTLLLCATANAKWVLNYALGVLASLSFLKTTELFVTQTYRAPNEPIAKRRWVPVLMVSKWVLFVAGLYLLHRLRYLDGMSLAAGLATLHVVLILKAIGILLQGAEDKGDHRKRTGGKGARYSEQK